MGYGQKREFSIKRRMLIILMGILVPILSFLLIYNLFVVDTANRNQADANAAALHLYCVQIERTMEALDSIMTNIVGTNNYFISLTYKERSEVNTHLNALEVTDRYEEMINFEKGLAACLLISKPNNIYRAKYRDDIHGYEMKDHILSHFRNKVLHGENLVSQIWQETVIMGKPYLYRCLGFRDTYCICLLDLEFFPVPQNADNSTASRIIFTGKEGQALTETQLAADHKILFREAEETGENRERGSVGYYFSGHPQKYMITTMGIQGADICASYLMPYGGALRTLNNSQYLLLLLSCLMAFLVPISYWLLKKAFFKPLDRLTDEMEEIQRSQDTAVLLPDEAYPELEFRKVNATLNNMLEQIRALKIEAYEKQINMQEILLQYYQIQIRPHFFLNCLKNIYGMAEERKYESIQKNILYLSNHLRYILRDSAQVVTLKDELQYIRNYILLQQLSAKYPPECLIDGAEEMMELKIPAVSVLSFVENAVKYYAGNADALKIHIRLNMLVNEEEEIANITICDNGKGFTEEQLSEYNYYDEKKNHGGHIGIHNVIQRFLLYYGRENVGFAFSNHNGAQVDIFIRNYREKEDESDSDR